MNEPLVCEDTDLDRLLETIRAEHGDAADILYQDSVRRGGVMGFFAQEVHRVVYRVCETGRDAAKPAAPTASAAPLEISHEAVDMHPFEAMLAQQAKTVERPSKPAPKTVATPTPRPAPAELEMPWLADLLDDEPSTPPRATQPEGAAQRTAAKPAKPAKAPAATAAKPAAAAKTAAAKSTAAKTAAVKSTAGKTAAAKTTAAKATPDPAELIDDADLPAEADARIVSYAFPRAEPTARPFNNKPQAIDEPVATAEESDNDMTATLEVTPIRMTAQERFAELLQAMEEAKAAEVEASQATETIELIVAEQLDADDEPDAYDQLDSVDEPDTEDELDLPDAHIDDDELDLVDVDITESQPEMAETDTAQTDTADIETASGETETYIAETDTAAGPDVDPTVAGEAEPAVAAEAQPPAPEAELGDGTSPVEQQVASVIADDTAATPVEAPIEAVGCPTIEGEPAEQIYEPVRIAQEPRAARHSAGEPDAVEDETSSPAPISSAPVREIAQVVSLPATGTGDARARMDMMMRLREVGVPTSVNPSGEAANIYEALDEILSELPPTPTPPRKPGDVLVIIGDIGPALRAAQSVARTLRLRDSDIWVADLESHPVVEIGGAAPANTRAIANPRHAARVRAELVQADVASVVVVATDGAEAAPNDPWIGEMLEALRPTAVWACVDATRKSSDTAARLALLGDIDALAVHSAAISSSPASVWEIGIPVALLDGRTAGVPTWAGLLLSLLSVEEPTAEIADESESRHSRSARHRSA